MTDETTFKPDSFSAQIATLVEQMKWMRKEVDDIKQLLIGRDEKFATKEEFESLQRELKPYKDFFWAIITACMIALATSGIALWRA